MKKNSRKVTLASVFACALLASSLGALNVNVASAVATEPEKFTMVDGASLRLENTDENIPFGMRFKTEVDPAWYDSLTNPQVYTVLLPTDMLGEAELTAETDDAVIVDIDESKIYTVFAGTDEEAYRFNAVLKNIPEDGYTREISVRSYITADNLDNPVYTPLATDSYSSVARSVTKVADLALTKDIDENTDKYSAVEKYLIKGIEANGTGLMIGGEGGYLGAKLAYNEGISDAVKAHLDAKYPLAYASDNEVAATIDEFGVLTAGDTEGTANITVSCAALGLEKTVAVQAYVPTYGELINFNAIDWTTISTYGAPIDLKVVRNGDKQAISYKMETVTGYPNYVGFYVYQNHYNAPEWFQSRRFDNVSITVALTEEGEEKGSNWWLLGTCDYSKYQGNSNYQLGNAVDEKKFTRDLPATADKTDGFYKKNTAAIWTQARNKNYTTSATFAVKDVTFGIWDIANTTGNTVNLLEKFYVDGTNNSASFTFTPTGGTAQAIDNPTAFAATEDGVITATISANGYKAGTVTAKYDYTKVVPYGQLVDFNDIDMTQILPAKNGAKDLKAVDLGNGKQGIQFTYETTTAAKSEQGIKIARPSWFENFDSVYLTVQITETGGDTTGSFCMYEWDTSVVWDYNNTQTVDITRGTEDFTTTHRYNKMIAENGYLTFSFRSRHSKIVTATV
ncbi:MAG: hypothetical protein IJW60_03180, partial [Clostridia bacterium]|nr:hypothetical protein [Clostridia bacterium]